MNTFMGFERQDGSVGVRNYVAVLPSVACANGVAAAISRGVPEAVPLYHGHGCGRAGADLEIHQRTLANIAKNPNVAAVLVVGLGCEVISAAALTLLTSLAKKPVENIVIQNEGGSRRAAEKGIGIVRRMLADAAHLDRREFPVSALRVGLECGGSDAFSGVTANPGVGIVADWLVAQGGTVVLTETTEMIGTGNILARRAKSPEVARAIVERIDAAEKRTHELLGPMASYVIAPGNMDGGMSSIQEKSLGCIVKAGGSTISQVVNYAEPPAEKGLVIMDGPGYDIESMAGVAAAGCQVMLFTTGRGNPIGFPVVPVIKIASTSRLFRSMEDDMDVNAGAVLEGKGLDKVADEIRGLLVRVASGEQTKAEINRQDGIICPWTMHSSF
ncbi:MAG: altronate dehydratase [Spirochaetes bacterium]|nr:MAG: altronate dehydratase [Spirochaetota bacterium]